MEMVRHLQKNGDQGLRRRLNNNGPKLTTILGKESLSMPLNQTTSGQLNSYGMALWRS
jgi:hypothetical protein